MKSNVCNIKNNSDSFDVIMKECEKVAVYNELDKKQSMHLRLLCEELDGMLPKMVGDYQGDLWIELENGILKINVSIGLSQISLERREELINLAKNKKNAAAVGIGGKIRAIVEGAFLNNGYADGNFMPMDAMMATARYDIGTSYSYYWSLGQYRTYVNEGKKTEEWDELEKSVIASLADDVIVGVKGKQVDIIVVKSF